MNQPTDTIELKFERTIPASPTRCLRLAEFQCPRQPLGHGGQGDLECLPRRAVLLIPHGNSPLWAIHGSGPPRPNPAHLGFARHLWPGNHSHGELRRARQWHTDDTGSHWSDGHGQGQIAQRWLELLPGQGVRSVHAVGREGLSRWHRHLQTQHI